MVYILVLFLMNGSEIVDTKTFPIFEDRQSCEEKGKAAVQYYKEQGLTVKAGCFRPA